MSSNDVWDQAANATVRPKVYFGQIFTDAFFCVLRKGIGKVPFDPGQHPADDKLACIKIDGQCTKRDGSSFVVQREEIAEFRDWAGIILPSVKALGIHPRELNEKWAKWRMVETGRTWVDKVSGETKKATTFQFLELFPDAAACQAAEAALYNREVQPELAPASGGTVDPQQDPQREVAAKFLPALYAQANGDAAKMAELLAANPLTSKYFDVNSVEVVTLFQFQPPKPGSEIPF